ncbi:hypothetical protein ABZP36_016085 [Zizania latifolia]
MVCALSCARGLLDGIPHRERSRLGLVRRCHGFIRVWLWRGGVRPDAYTFPPLLKAAAAARGATVGGAVHAHVIKFGMESNAHATSSLIVMSEWFELSCCSLVDMVRAGAMPTPVTYVSMLSACRKGKDLLLGIQVHKRILESGVSPNLRLENAPVDMFKEALETFRHMQFCKVRADEFTMVSVVTACAQLDMYSKRGSINRALGAFKEMHNRDKFTWTTIILGLVVNGHGKEAIDMFYRILKALQTPDEVTFVGVLTACSHAGLVDKGREFFLSMTETYKIAPTVMH